MIEIKATHPDHPTAFLAGLGLGPFSPSVQKAIQPSATLPPALRTAIMDAAAGPSTGGGSGAGADTGGGGSDSSTDTTPKGINWPLALGIGAGVLLLGVLIIKR